MSASPRPSSCSGIVYSLLHDGRRGDRARAGAGLEAGRLSCPARSRRSWSPRNDVYVYQALKTPQFWLIWWVLCLNVTAGIGVLGQASAMSQEMFPGRVTAAAAGGFVGLISLFNMGGRFFWASISDYIGRKNTYFCFFAARHRALCARALLRRRAAICRCSSCASASSSACMAAASPPCRPICSDMFGTRYVGAIHGLLITAWSAAGVLGPVLVNYIRQYQIDSGVPKAQAYNVTMYIMAGLLVIGFICNLADPGGPRPAPHAAGDGGRHHRRGLRRQTWRDEPRCSTTTGIELALAWGFVGIPLLWGVYGTLINAMKLFY